MLDARTHWFRPKRQMDNTQQKGMCQKVIFDTVYCLTVLKDIGGASYGDLLESRK